MVEQATQLPLLEQVTVGYSGVHWDVNSGGEAEAFRTAMRRIVGVLL